MEDKKSLLEQNQGFIEFELAWKEFFQNKSKPKNDEENKKQQEEFNHWYNYVRKQTDTGKTPAEMYKEKYGREPEKGSNEISRMMNFEWDEDYNEEEFEDNAQKEAFSIANEFFENNVWKEEKRDLKEMKKKEACKFMFVSGFMTYMKFMDENLLDFKEKAKKNPKEFEKDLKKLRDILTNQ